MQVLSEGVPMTCGEVYALLRRRRDERSAMRQPPFALQLAQADPRSRLANRGNSNNNSNALTATAAAAAAQSTSTRAVGANGNNMAPHITTTTPMNVTSHVFVLLSEVQLLSYLYHHGRLSTELNQSLPALYGPSSVYVPVNEEDTNSKEGVCDSAQLAWLAKVRECRQKVAATQPGREDHVQHVQALLTLYEEHGQTAEADAATAVRQLLRDMHTQGYWPCSPPQQPTQSSADVVRVKQEVRDDDDEQLVYGMDNNNTTGATMSGAMSSTVQQQGSGGMNGTSITLRQTLAGTPLLSAPSSLLCDDFALQAAPTASRTVADPTTSTHLQSMISRSNLLSEEELMRVVMARPCSSLDVHRLLDGLDERLAGREEAVTFFVEGLTRIFTRS